MKNLILNENTLSVSDVKKIISCLQNQTAIECSSNKIVVSGNEIEIKKLDLENGEVVLSGNFTNIKLSSQGEKRNLIKRIFK